MIRGRVRRLKVGSTNAAADREQIAAAKGKVSCLLRILEDMLFAARDYVIVALRGIVQKE